MLDIAAVKERTNLLDLISTTTDLRKVGAKEFSGSCPKCGGRDRFHYNEDRGWFCRVCTQAPDDGGHWHDAIDFIQWRDGCDFMTAYNRLGGDTRMSPAESAQLLAERTVRQQEQRKAEQAAQADRRRELDTSNAWANFHANLDRYDKRELWTRRGLSPFWQDYYKVGYCPSRSFAHADDFFTSETLTIPTFYVTQVKYECIALVHRLLIAEPPGGKYRPHLAGTGKPLFYTDPLRSEFMPGGDVLIVEGEIKAAVTYAYLQEYVDKNWSSRLADLQVVGAAGKSFKPDYAEQFDGVGRIWICMDPDADKSAQNIAHLLGCERSRIVTLPGKIDDMLIEGSLSMDNFEQYLNGARRM